MKWEEEDTNEAGLTEKGQTFLDIIVLLIIALIGFGIGYGLAYLLTFFL